MREASWPWNANARRGAAYVTAAVISLAIYLIVFGPRHMFGMSRYWDLPQDDQIQYLIGYRYFLHEPWHWPLFVTHTMNVPLRESIAFTDSIPLWALINKAIATICPPWGTFTIRAYLGLWYAVVYCLQGCLGLAILRRLGHRSWATAILVPPMMIAVPAFAIRYAHASLSAHFLILWALYLYLCTPSRAAPPRRLVTGWLVELACAALINPYHTVMSFGLFVAAMLRSRNARAVATWMPAGIAAIGIAAWIAGYFSSAAGVHMEGFHDAGTNLLSFVVPARSGLLGTTTWIANVQATPLEYEGWAYLGIGYLVLLFVVLACHARAVGLTIRRHPFLFTLVAATWIFSLSDHIYFGSHLALSFSYPRVLHWIPDQFRAPGRFVWLPQYVLIVFLVHRGSALLSRDWRRAVLPVLVIAQLADTYGAWQWPLSSTDHGRKDELISMDAWRPIVLGHAAIVVLPSYVCALDGTPHVDQVSREIEFLASERAVPINGVYSARPMRDCVADRDTWSTLQPQPDTLYVLLPQATRARWRLEQLGASCASFAYGAACSLNRAVIEDAVRAGTLTDSTVPAPLLACNQRVELGKAPAMEYLLDGWSYAEDWGRWMKGDSASIDFRFDTTKCLPHDVALRVSAPLCGRRHSQDFSIVLQGTQLGSVHLDRSSDNRDKVWRFPIPHPEQLTGPRSILELHASDHRSPRALGCNDDERPLALAVRDIWLE